MTYRGHVEDGKVVLEDAADLPDGMPVQVRPVKPRRLPARRKRKLPPTLYERLKPFIGKVKDLPDDFSVNHDHYLYGTPRQR